MSEADCVIVMARFPVPGAAKTRLIPALGASGAASLHQRLVRRTLNCVDEFRRSCPGAVRIHFTGGDESHMQSLFGTHRQYCPQIGTTLGDRMNNAVEAAFRAGASRVAVIGTDCASLTPEHLKYAFAKLKRSDVAIGPALDGGYYLIAMRTPHPRLFEGIDWGTEHVLRQTMTQAQQIRASVQKLPSLSDIDYPEDLIQCRKRPQDFTDIFPATQPGLLSVIIPALNEESTITTALTNLKGIPGIEVIVADGGSTDRTCDVAESCGAIVVKSNRGRGRQMNAGAAIANGDVLLFLHADACLPEGFALKIRECLAGKNCVAGAFRLRIDGVHPLLRVVESGANLRSRWLQLPYGDQAIFVGAQTFFQLDGFRNWPLMEDYDFCQRLKKLGKVSQVPADVSVSARRWHKLGILKTTIINQLCVVGFRLGLSPERLQKFYTRKK